VGSQEGGRLESSSSMLNRQVRRCCRRRKYPRRKFVRIRLWTLLDLEIKLSWTTP